MKMKTLQELNAAAIEKLVDDICFMVKEVGVTFNNAVDVAFSKTTLGVASQLLAEKRAKQKLEGGSHA